VTDGHVVLILLLQLQTRTQLTLANKRRFWHGKRNLHLVRWQGPISVQYRPYKVFLLFLYLRGVLFKNLNDATLSSLLGQSLQYAN